MDTPLCRCLCVLLRPYYTDECGEVSSPDVGIDVGIDMRIDVGIDEEDVCSPNAFAWLEQIQLCCPFDGCPTIRDVEFTVDALGMGADRA